MAGITQTIPNYNGGMSEQPDQLKKPGQVKSIINGIPDPVYGLYKRPGAKRIGTSALANVSSADGGGSWFHYYRDSTEGAYIGQVASNGRVRIWSCNDGTEKNVWYDTDNQAYSGGDSDHTSITSYLTPSPATDSEDIQALTINDTTFLNNRSKTVATTGTTAGRPDTHCAFIELQRAENGRQYALNIYDSDSTSAITKVTRGTITYDDLNIDGGTGRCRGIGTQVFAVTNPLTATISNAGSGYSSAPSVTFSGGNGSGAAATAVVSGGQITGFNFTNYGSGYTSAPSVSLSGGGGSNGAVSIAINAAKKNLIFRITVLGQVGTHENANADDSGIDGGGYCCAYNKQLQILHGGEGWAVDDEVHCHLSSADGGSGVGNSNSPPTFKWKVEKIETVNVKANIKAVRPEPTPFDVDTCVTADSILGGIESELSGTGITVKVIGNGLYLTKSSAFNVEVVDQDLMKVIQKETDAIQDLPNQCKHGYIVKISNAKDSTEDDLWMKFEGENDKDGPGKWVECAEPGIVKSFDATTMPHVLQRQSDGDFLVTKHTWAHREVGDNETNLIPTFVGKKINRVLFFRNRLTFLSGTNVITSKAGKLNDFWAETALTVSAIDPIDITSSSSFPSDLYDGIELATGLLVFSSNQQFLLSSDAEVFNPDTAKLRPISAYNYNIAIPPISTGIATGYIDNSGKYSRFNEMIRVGRENEPMVSETSKIVPTILPKDIDLITNSRENSLIFFGKSGSNEVIGYKYFQNGDRREQSAWFKWKFKNNLKYHFVIDDEYFFLDSNNFLQKVNIIQADSDPSIDQDSVNYLIHLDNWVTVTNAGSYNATTNLTTFANATDWIDDITNGSSNLVLVDTDANATRIGRYASCTVTNTDDFTVPGDWSGNITLHIGYLYDYQVDLPRIYVNKSQGNVTQSDINSYLTLHRLNFNFGKIGLYETILSRVGKADYSEVHESAFADSYDVSDAPYISEEVKTIPVYDKNENVDITLKSSHPAPAVLRSVSWEGDYSQKFYRRV